ncbi:hypothetical protein RBI22_14260 [Alcaligenaceae bacterium C4P045]|nr:hypothetical protein [Alcaligenaceae bacterium C4P045]
MKPARKSESDSSPLHALPSARKQVKARAPAVKQVEVSYGGVSVLVAQPTDDQLKTNVRRSTRVMSSLGKKISKPGVKLAEKKNIPFYSVDARDPSLMVRLLNGTKIKGHLINGTFIPAKTTKRSAGA